MMLINWMFVILPALVWLSCAGQGRGDSEAQPEAPPEPSICWRIGSVPGPEDLVVDRSQGEPRLLVSSQDRRADPAPEGGIYAISLAADGPSEARRLRLEGRDGCTFHPHGIDLIQRAETGRWLLYVVNHHEPADTSPRRGCLPEAERLARHGREFTSVEVYRVERHRLRFVQRLADPDVLPNGNDLVALAGGDVFVTAPPAGLLDRAMESLGLATTSQIVRIACGEESAGDRCADPAFRPVGEPFGRYLNGIEAKETPAGPRLFVASTLEDKLYQIDLARGDEPQPIAATSGFDNLAWESEDGDVLLAAGHHDMRRFLQHAWSSEVPSPSRVWALPVPGSGESGEAGDVGALEVLYSDGGSQISAASSAVCFAGGLVVGQVFESAILRCEASCGDPRGVTP